MHNLWDVGKMPRTDCQHLLKPGELVRCCRSSLQMLIKLQIKCTKMSTHALLNSSLWMENNFFFLPTNLPFGKPIVLLWSFAMNLLSCYNLLSYYDLAMIIPVLCDMYKIYRIMLATSMYLDPNHWHFHYIIGIYHVLGGKGESRLQKIL